MARKDMTTMLGSIPKREPLAPDVDAVAVSGLAERGARFDALERKEARLRADQVEALARLQRSLNRARGGRGRRVTENTLIRLGVDLLLAREPDLAGVDEGSLAASLGLPDRP